MASVTHAKTSAKSDGGDSTLIQPSDWNAAHTLSGLPSFSWTSGTSMPGSPSTNDRVTRTDLGMDFYYDGTRWLSVNVVYASMPQGDIGAWPNTGGGVMGRLSLPAPTYSIYLVGVYGTTYVTTTNTGSAYWTVSFISDPGATTEASFTTSADSANTHTGHLVTVGSVLGSGVRTIAMSLAKTGSPGSIYAPTIVAYRLVGT